MNFWTFLDRNSGGIGFLILIGLILAFGAAGDRHEGCRVRCGTGEASVTPSDAGAP